jgi:hypothetical protein
MLIGTLVFGNTIRFSEVVGFNWRPSFHGTPVYFARDYDPSRRAGLDLTPTPEKVAEMPETAPWKAWNLMEGTHLYDGPLGIRVGSEVRHLILRHNPVFVAGEQIKDETGGQGVKAFE